MDHKGSISTSSGKGSYSPQRPAAGGPSAASNSTRNAQAAATYLIPPAAANDVEERNGLLRSYGSSRQNIPTGPPTHYEDDVDGAASETTEVYESKRKRFKRHIKSTIPKALAAKFFRKRTEIPKGIPDNAVPGNEQGVWYGYFPYDTALADPFWVWWFLQIFGNLGTAAIAGVTIFFSFGASWFPIGIASVCAAIAVNIGMYGEWAYHRGDKRNHVYFHMLTLYLMNFFLLALSVYAYIGIPEGEEYFVENWWNLQTKVLPFTTLLDSKAMYSQFTTISMALGIFMFAINLIAILRAWNFLGGAVTMISHGLQMMLPQLLVILATSTATGALSLDTAKECMFARKYKPDDIYLTATVSFLLATSVIVLCFLTVRWGNHHLTFSANGTFYLLFSTLLLISSSVVQDRSSSTSSFVESNWSVIQNFVPENFADKSWHKYALSCSALLSQTAAMGLLCSLFSILYSMSALRAAFVAISLGEGGFEALVEENIKHSQSIGKRSLTGYGAVEDRMRSASEQSSDTGTYNAAQWNRALTELDLNKSGMARRKDSNASFTLSDAISEAPEPSDDPSKLLKDHPLPSATEWASVSASDLKSMLKNHTKYSIFVASLAVAAVISIGVGMGNVSSQLKCHKLVHNPFFTSMNFSVPFSSDAYFSLTHKFPRGTVSFIPASEWPQGADPLPDDHLGFIVKQWNTNGSPTFNKTELLEKILSGRGECGSFDDDGCQVALDFSPAAIGKASHTSREECDAIQVVVYYPFDGDMYGMTLELFSESAFVNISGPTDLFSIILSGRMTEVLVHTQSSPVLVTNIPVLVVPAESSSVRRNVEVQSKTGDVTLSLVLGRGIQVRSGGDIFVESVLSAILVPHFGADPSIFIDGDVSLLAEGSGRVLASALLMGENIFLHSDKGKILCQNSVSYIMFDTSIISNKGEVILNSWLPLSGNLTYIRTASSITGSFMFANYVDAVSTSGSISFLELFLGLDTPAEEFFPDNVEPFNNTLPGIEATANKGSVSLVGLSAGLLNSNPNEDWADDLRIKLSSISGNVKMQINGGGYNGHYCTHSKFGRSPVEINGRKVPSKGVIDKNSDGIGYANLTTIRGDTQLVVLPSPLGAELF